MTWNGGVEKYMRLSGKQIHKLWKLSEVALSGGADWCNMSRSDN